MQSLGPGSVEGAFGLTYSAGEVPSLVLTRFAEPRRLKSWME